ncbi:MAG: hypothetical protein DMG40_28035 [Acidobacteria bacterium]|nr:MAG: hypothetical protein DMG40_28035 [Acidobacteriota bacterium]
MKRFHAKPGERRCLQIEKFLFGLITFLVAVLAIFAATASADGQHSGVWKLNPAKSKYSPGPGPKELTETILLSMNRYKVDANGTGADGKPMHIEFDAKFDGKDYPMIGVPWADTDGQVTMIITCAVSTNGRTRTCTLKGTDEEGRKVNNVVVFHRQ